MKAVYLESVPADVESILRECCPGELELSVLQPDQSPETAVADVDFILVATTKVTRAVFHSAPKLRHIQHQGVGYNNIDLDAARDHGVTIGLTPEGTSIPVAETVFMLVLSLYRNLFAARQSLRDGQWLQWELRPHSYDLVGKTFGIIGMGRIGRELAVRARAFGCPVIYTDIAQVPHDQEQDLGISFTSLDNLLQQADIVTIHVPLLDETRNLIGSAELSKMKASAILINAARGGLVDEAALSDALTSGSLAGAGLDVFEQEPPPHDHPLLHLENVIAIPHIAAGTRDAYATKMTAAFENMLRVSRGEPPINEVKL